jgi:hypothetical protein
LDAKKLFSRVARTGGIGNDAMLASLFGVPNIPA